MEIVYLREAVYSENDMLAVLGMKKEALDELRRESGFPFVRVTARCRVYLAKDVLSWLDQHKRNQPEQRSD